MVLGAAGLTPTDITVLLASLAVLLGAARVMGELARRFRQPAVFGEIIAGILLGPTVLGFFQPDVFHWLFPDTGAARITLDGFITLAVALLMLVAGLEVDLSTIWRQGKSTLVISVNGIVFPFIVGFATAWFLPGWLGIGENDAILPFALFVGIALSITALPVIAKVLMDLNILKSDIGMLIMSAAMLNDVVGWIGFAMVLAMISHTGDPSAGATASPIPGMNVPTTILLTISFLALMLTIGRWLVHRLLPLIQAHWSWPGGVLGFVLVSALTCAAFTEAIGIHSIFGAFIAGVAIGDSERLRERTRDHIHQFITNIFAPVFFASIGLRINFVTSFDLGMVVLVLFIALIGKIGGCYLGGRWTGMSKRESWAVGFGMAARGAMEVILGQLARQANLITDELFVAIIIMALVTSLMAGPAIEWLLARKQRRRLSELVSERHFVPSMQATTVREAIGELAQRGAEVTGVPAEVIDKSAWRREQIMPTGIGQGLAVPHARLDELSKSVVIIGRSHQGVDFDASDGQPAQIICLLLTPRQDQSAQLELLDTVVRTFIIPEVRVHTMEARTFTELRAALNQAGPAGTSEDAPAVMPGSAPIGRGAGPISAEAGKPTDGTRNGGDRPSEPQRPST